VYSNKVLGPKFHRKTIMTKVWKVKHWISASSYVPHVADSQWLPTEYELGRQQIRDYVLHLAAHHNNGTTTTTTKTPAAYDIAEALPFLHESETVKAVQQYLPADGNLLVWGFTEADSPTWHMATSGRVMFLGDSDPSRIVTHNLHKMVMNDYVYNTYPFLAHSNAVFKTPRGDYWNETVRTYLTGQSFANNTNWCDLLVPLLPRHLFESEWDVILVQDQRSANGDKLGAGILQPLFNSMLIVAHQQQTMALSSSSSSSTNNGTTAAKKKLPHIIVNNYHRPFEQNVMQQIFGRAPDAILCGDGDDKNLMAVYSIRHDDRSYSWASDCPRRLLRLPRMYVGPWSKVDVTKVVDLIQPTDNVLVLGIQNQPRFWHYATSGEVLFLENTQNATQIARLVDEFPELSILPVNFTSHAVPTDRLSATAWNVLMIHPFVRDRIPFWGELDRCKSLLLKRGLLVIVADYQIPDVAKYANKLLGDKPILTIARGPKKTQLLIAVFRL
jgi:Polysaccharide biosynthesis